MRTELAQVFAGAGLDDAATHALVEALEHPPPGSIDRAELEAASPERAGVLALVLAVWRRRMDEVERLLAWLGPRQASFDDYDAGRYWHIVGWRASHAESYRRAHLALNRSIRHLDEATGRQVRGAAGYRARVYDTYGIVLRRQGLLQEAREQFDTALTLKRAAGDEAGEAITLGNLARLAVDRGDFREAYAHFAGDLAILDRIDAANLRERAALRTQRAMCAVELELFDDARALFAEAERMAASPEGARRDPETPAFVALGRGLLSLREGAPDRARAEFLEAIRIVEEHGRPPEVRLRAKEGLAEMAARDGALPLAVALFTEVRSEWQRTGGSTGLTQVDKAHNLRGLARALSQQGNLGEAARLLREALRLLDATAAEVLREGIEEELRTQSQYDWLYHVAERFVGQVEMELALRGTVGGGEPSAVEGSEKVVAVLFSDIRGFTSWSERLEPRVLVQQLNGFLSQMTRCIAAERGVVDKFIGDAVMAVFGLEGARRGDEPPDAERAVVAALAMREELERFNRRQASLNNGDAAAQRLAIGIGLHAGKVVAGLVGSRQKQSHTVIGDVVNTASRLEGLTKQLGASILVSKDLVAQMRRPERFLLRPLGRYAPKGRQSAVEVYDVLGEEDESLDTTRATAEIEAAQDALARLHGRDFPGAAVAYEALARNHPAHEAGYALLARQARAFVAEPPPPDWNGVIVMSEK